MIWNNSQMNIAADLSEINAMRERNTIHAWPSFVSQGTDTEILRGVSVAFWWFKSLRWA